MRRHPPEFGLWDEGVHVLVRYKFCGAVVYCRTNLATTMYSNSMIGVGMASTLYHTSRGKVRGLTRWGDYAMIATSTLVGHLPFPFFGSDLKIEKKVRAEDFVEV